MVPLLEKQNAQLNPAQLKALDLSANRVISASAGTGKTQTLITLYAGLLEGRLTPGGAYLDESEWLRRANTLGCARLRPADIVAVTFSEKAAAELRQRARDTLMDRLKLPGLSAELKAHLQKCASELSGAPVCTIHAFCARILREGGAQAAVPAAFSVLQEEDAEALLDAALAEAAGELLESGGYPELQKMAAAWNIFTPRNGLVYVGLRLIRQLRARGLSAEAFLKISSGPPLSLDAIREMLAAFYSAVLKAKDKGNSKRKPELLELCAARKIPGSLEEARLAALELAPLLATPWMNFNNLENPCTAITSAAHPPYVRALRAFVALALENYARSKRAAGYLDFDDLLLCCRDVLKTQPPHDCKFVLIDEFQDTNPLQKEILWRVAFGGAAPGGSARLCVVGDVKQSIYRFRGADVSLMREAGEIFARSTLSENYRSRSMVLDFINSFCALMWRDSGFDYSDGHRLEAMQSESRHAWTAPAAELLCWAPEDVGSAAEHRVKQALVIARRIRTLINPEAQSTLTRPQVFDREKKVMRAEVHFGDIAILAGSLKHLRQPLQLALSQLRIPFKILGGVAFYSRQEVLDAMNLWGAACNPGDAHAVAGLLRSPFVSLSDAGLWRLSEAWQNARGAARISTGHALLDERFIAALPAAHFSAEDAAALARAAKIMRTAHGMAGRKTAVEILDWALAESGYLAVLAMQPRGETAVAAVRKTIELARAFESKGNTQLSDFVHWLKERADAEWDDPGCAGGPDLSGELPPDEDAVSIGTIHSAKGLEFPIVFIPELGARQPNLTDAALFSEEHGLGLKLSAFAEGLPALADETYLRNAELEKAEAEAENLRKFYVALTRARDYLVLLGEIPKGGNGPWRKLVDQFLTAHRPLLSEVDVKHPGLKKAAAEGPAGILVFVDDAAHLHADLPERGQSHAPLPDLAAEDALLARAAAGSARTSVSHFAHWLWCPRQALFQAQEPAPEPHARDREEAESGHREASGGADEIVSDSRALGTAAHAALEFIFGSEEPDAPGSADRAAECFLRALGADENQPDVKFTLERVQALARSPWGKAALALKPGQRLVERPFRLRLKCGGADDAHLTITGRIDLLVQRADARWEVVDFKLSARADTETHAGALARYAWQAGIYAQVAAQALHVPAENIAAELVFLKDADNRPLPLKALGHAQPSAALLRDAARQFVELSACTEPLALPAQRWEPRDDQPQARDKKMCLAERCPFVARCFGHG